MKNKNLLFIIGMIYLIGFISGVLSLGITPGRTTIDFELGKEKEIEFDILNNEHKNMKVFLMIGGELNDSIELSESFVEFSASEESKHLKYKVKLTGKEKLKQEPGLHIGEVIAIEVPSGSVQGSVVGSTVAVVTQLYVYVACPGKCIDTDLNVFDAESNGTATFVVPVVNRGKTGIGNVRAIIDIYSPMNEKLDSVQSDSAALDVGSRTELTAKWDIKLGTGSYLAKVTVFFDEESKSIDKQFNVGDKALSIESIFVNNFQLGQIAKLQILVENRWNQDLNSVYANLLVYNDEQQVMADIKSAGENLPPLTKKELIAYWDTVGVAEGEYTGKLMVKYGEKSADRNLVLKVGEDNLDVTGVGYAIRPQVGGKGTDITTILLILVIILLVVNLAWFVFFKRIMGKNKSENPTKKKK
ncbi:MAG: hypothetical protein WC867_03760 [Candidatus Pacearchaeota archaeon]|jgi:hypothetical protein